MLLKTYITPRSRKTGENLKIWGKKKRKKSFGLGKKSFGSDTDTKIGSWFRFSIPKPGFGRTLICTKAIWLVDNLTRLFWAVRDERQYEWAVPIAL